MMILCLLLQAFLLAAASATDTAYHERLVLQPLAPASLLASFNFRSNASVASFERQHFGHFPRSLGQILQHAKTRELHLKFSTGRWDAESWGTRPWDGAKEGGTGVEIWAWVEADTEEEAFARWITLNNALSGLFCASMNFIDSTRTTRPVMTFEPQGDHKNTTAGSLHLLHGTLPREVVCTENLTPFLKLLPCKGKAGIASLLDGHRLFDATWQTMSIDVRPVCPTGGECVVEIDQAVDMVLDIERAQRPRDDPIPRPVPIEKLLCDLTRQYAAADACYPVDLSQSQQWSLMSVFGKTVKGTCMATNPANAEPICINAPHDLDVYLSQGGSERKDKAGYTRCFTVPALDAFEIMIPKQDPPKAHPPATPPLFAERSVTGHGQERGGVRALLTNPSLTETVEFVYFETLPWFMKLYLHTLSARVSPIPSAASTQDRKSTDASHMIKDIYFRPGLDRERGSQLELHIAVPPQSTMTLTYDFDKAILRYTEYPPDANRGRDVAPAIIRLLPRSGSDSNPAFLRTTPLMLPLPTPDFSMPYNVIILTSTVIALSFGMVYNMLTRRFVAFDEGERQGLRSVILNALQKISGAVLKARKPSSPETAAKKQQ